MEPVFQVLPPERPQPQPPKRGWGALGGVIAAVGVMLVKFATPLLILLKTGGTMLLSVGAYSFALGWSWQLATGIVVLIFVHEMGHVISAKYYGIPVTAPVFIPLMGAYVLLKNRPQDPWVNGIISYAGPLAGGLGGWACYAAGLALGWPWLFSVAFYTFILNLVNLAPLPPMDGSHIWIAFSRTWTPNMSMSDRCYMGLYLAALIAGLLLGILHSWRFFHSLT
jgi:Zn-dependent protease